ncbi:L-carnitine/gamma-butyrobetaine antiport BCCT transporter [Pseudodesulfovibrio sp. JC047]|uniref:L-carnitine/gamma-butyrobetaine antiporter n=1 Tax=Pseudodesulfovibrio sp. JC047 TaxID=2683199 RepID=UPI0013CF9AFF|nr:L-carnitine/gamma-butyrobetaine antiporter [Pseudodesulfovibrio sp. JC047]NDV18388.1 L-carnitine/gamma-butyrobetaine antiport BCCT transporter [Pseudodesulfovibrio sp. JC047]
MEPNKTKKVKIDPKVFFPSLTIVGILSYLTVRDLDAANKVINTLFSYVTNTWGWAFEWYMIIMLIGWLWMVFGPWKNNKLGEEEPEFSTASWVFLLFASSTSAAVLFWGSYEAYCYVSTPPFGFEPFSVTAKEYGLAYSLFHWGPLPWAGYGFFTVAFGYFLFVKKINVMRPSGTLAPIIGEKNCKGILGAIIDNMYIVGLILAMGTSLGLSTPLVTECIEWLFGIPHTLQLDATIIACWILLNAICVAFGLSKGVKMASDLRSYLSIFVLLWILCLGGTTFIFNYFTDSVGIMLSNFTRMLFYTDPIRGGGFPQGWTVFYWAWWVIYGIQTCLFLARISRGRTVRQVCVGMVSGLTATTWFMWTVLSGNTMDLIHRGVINMPELVAKYGAPRAVIETWAALPFSTATMVIFFVLCFIATVTLINACSYTLAMSTCTEADGYSEPPVWVRVGWSVLVGIIGVTLLALGGLKPLQTAIIAGGCPLFFVNLMIIWSFIKDARANNW